LPVILTEVVRTLSVIRIKRRLLRAFANWHPDEVQVRGPLVRGSGLGAMGERVNPSRASVKSRTAQELQSALVRGSADDYNRAHGEALQEARDLPRHRRPAREHGWGDHRR